MRTIKANIMELAKQPATDAICFTSNGMLNKDGKLIMGAGVAKVFRDTYNGIDEEFGRLVEKGGNVVYALENYTPAILNYPTKHHWKNPSDLKLIERSAQNLKDLMDCKDWKVVYLPAPGINLGGLDWKDVERVLDNVFGNDERLIITFW